MDNGRWKKRLAVSVVAATLAGGGVFVWRQLQPADLPESFAVGNGRIEATEIDIAVKAAGRIKEILVNDGDVVEAGQVVARMDTQTLEAELRQAHSYSRLHQSFTRVSPLSIEAPPRMPEGCNRPRRLQPQCNRPVGTEILAENRRSRRLPEQ
jgi:Biotin-lipoyl like